MLRRAVVCSVREDVITGVWLFSGGVYTRERVTQQCLRLVSRPRSKSE